MVNILKVINSREDNRQQVRCLSLYLTCAWGAHWVGLGPAMESQGELSAGKSHLSFNSKKAKRQTVKGWWWDRVGWTTCYRQRSNWKELPNSGSSK